MDDNVPNPRWKDVYDRVVNERRELDNEIERQRLLDELADSRTKNTQLEHALAKLAREQDRIALMERERVLKRAQVAQATAYLVHEANWAKQRMEAEMKVAKQRALILDPPKTEYQQTGPSLKSVSMGGAPITFANIPYEVADSTRPPEAKYETEPSQASKDHAEAAADDDALVIPDIASIGTALSSSYAGVMSSFFGTDQLPGFAPTPAMSSVAQPSEMSQPKAVVAPKKKKVPSARSAAVAPSASALAESESVTARKRLVKGGFNGEWKNPALQDQASEIISNSTRQREKELQAKPVMMGQMFGLPIGKEDSTPVVQTKQEWVAMADDWLKSVSSDSKPVDRAKSATEVEQTQATKKSIPEKREATSRGPLASAAIDKESEPRISKENSIAPYPNGMPPDKPTVAPVDQKADAAGGPQNGGKDAKDKKCSIM